MTEWGIYEKNAFNITCRSHNSVQHKVCICLITGKFSNTVIHSRNIRKKCKNACQYTDYGTDEHRGPEGSRKKALKESTSLDAFALMRASDMAENHYFSHYRGNDLQLDELGLIYPDFYYGSSGENLFRVRFKKSQDQLAESCVSAWAASQAHYVNMTDVRWETMGAAAVSSDDGYTYAVQIFSSQDAK